MNIKNSNDRKRVTYHLIKERTNYSSWPLKGSQNGRRLFWYYVLDIKGDYSICQQQFLPSHEQFGFHCFTFVLVYSTFLPFCKDNNVRAL